MERDGEWEGADQPPYSFFCFSCISLSVVACFQGLLRRGAELLLFCESEEQLGTEGGSSVIWSHAPEWCISCAHRKPCGFHMHGGGQTPRCRGLRMEFSGEVRPSCLSKLPSCFPVKCTPEWVLRVLRFAE